MLFTTTPTGTTNWTTVKRMYTHAGTAVASRTTTAAGVNELTYLLGNHQGSITTTITNGQAATRWYDPYGGRRGPDPTVQPTTTGFLNQHEDQTGLTYLNNRYHDPEIGIFVSVDPLVDLTLEPYVYARSNPINNSDPTGLLCAGGGYSDCLRSLVRSSFQAELKRIKSRLDQDEDSPDYLKQKALEDLMFEQCLAWANFDWPEPDPLERLPRDTLSQLASEVDNILQDLGTAGGVCIVGGTGAVAVAEGSACVLDVDGDAIATLSITAGAGFDLSARVGYAFTNADERQQLEGLSACYGGGAAWTASVCFGLDESDENLVPTGTWLAFVGASVGYPSGSATIGVTKVIDVPDIPDLPFLFDLRPIRSYFSIHVFVG